jgi:hypothetical protein
VNQRPFQVLAFIRRQLSLEVIVEFFRSHLFVGGSERKLSCASG